MNVRSAGLTLAVVQLLLVSGIGLKYAADRARLPSGWARTVPFDPSLHEAVSVLPADDPAKDHTVSATFQAGYRFKGSLLRPARVQVFSSEGHV